MEVTLGWGESVSYKYMFLTVNKVYNIHCIFFIESMCYVANINLPSILNVLSQENYFVLLL